MAKRKHQQSIKFYQQCTQLSQNSPSQIYVLKAKFLIKNVWIVSIPGLKKIFLVCALSSTQLHVFAAELHCACDCNTHGYLSQYWLPVFTALNFFWPVPLIIRIFFDWRNLRFAESR